MNVFERLVLLQGHFSHPGQFQHGEECGHKQSDRDLSGKEGGEGEPAFGFHPVNQPLHLIGDGDLFVSDFADNHLFRQTAEHEIERVPQFDAIKGIERTLADGNGQAGDVASQQALLEFRQTIEFLRGLLEFLVLEQLVNQFPAWIDAVLFAALEVDRRFAPGEQHAAFDLHQGGSHDKKFSRHIEIEFPHIVEDLDVLFGDRFDRDIVDIELVFSDEEKQEVERALKNGQFNTKIGVGYHGEREA